VVVVIGTTMAIRRAFSISLSNPSTPALIAGVAVAAIVLLLSIVGILRSARLHMLLHKASRPPGGKGRRTPPDSMSERILTEIDAADLGLGSVKFRMVVVDRGAFAVAYMTPGFAIDRTEDIAPLRLGEGGRAALARVGWSEPERRTVGSEKDWQYTGMEYTGPGADLADNEGIALSAGQVAVLLTCGDEAVAGPVRDLIGRARLHP
jgi:hypothetical protein